MNPTPIIAFRIKPDLRRTYYFRVEVYRTIKDLRRCPHPVTGRTHGQSRMLGACFGYRRERRDGRRARVSPELGTLRFAKSRLGVGVVAHEVFHATMRLLQRLEIQLPDEDRSNSPEQYVGEAEEMACRAQQNMMYQIYDRLYSKGVIAPGKG